MWFKRKGAAKGVTKGAPSAARNRQTGRYRPLRVLLVFLAAVSLCSYLDRGDIKGFGFGYFERFPRQVLLNAAAARHPDLVEWARQQIVLVSISDTTFGPDSELESPPVPRHYHAKIIRDLTQAGAKVIAFDLLFDLPSNPAEDQALAQAARQAPSVIWASIPTSDEDDQQAILPLPLLLEANPSHGHILVPQKSQRPEVDSVEAALFYRPDEAVPSLGVAAALAKLGWEDISLKRGQSSWEAGPLTFPVDAQGYSAISYMGLAGEESGDYFFPRMPYENLMAGAARSEFFRSNQFFKDKIIIIGDSTTVGNDFRNTPVGYMWGPEIHAHMAASVLLAAQKNYPLLREADASENLFVIVVLSALVCLLAAIWRLQWASAAALILLAAYYVLNFWLFADYRLALHIVAPTAAVVLVMLGMLTERGLSEEREKRRMRNLLQRYVSEAIADYVTNNPEKCYLGGDRVTATVLFSDIRGFTSLAERLSPEEVLNLLNEYMEAMTEVVYRFDGTVDKFIGDGIMAVFGVPAPTENHAYQAVATAIAMQEELLKFHQVWAERGVPLFDIGIGINTGDMVFGNIGSSKRMDFSVIGDAVNVASRTEALNREWGTRILITEATYEAVKDKIRARGPLPAALRGKEEAVQIYEVYGWFEGETATAPKLNPPEDFSTL
ncbi:MAG TPA: adenylate/guanylate cyclase domain-containing protein [Abditibacteriaceae bacterium]|jgi:adenylate cyclase